MKPVLALAGIAAVLAVAAAAARRSASTPDAARFESAAPAATAPCPPRSLPDHGVCVPVPSAQAEGARAPARRDAIVPRRPDRRAEPQAYAWPVALGSPDAVAFEARVDDSKIPDDLAARVTGVLVRAPLGASVGVAALEGQEGKAVLLYSGDLFGPTAITRHRVKTGKDTRDYVVLSGNLASAPSLATGASLEPNQRLGAVSDSVTPGTPALYLDIRQLRAGLAAESLTARALLDPTHSIPVDPRNVLTRAKP